MVGVPLQLEVESPLLMGMLGVEISDIITLPEYAKHQQPIPEHLLELELQGEVGDDGNSGVAILPWNIGHEPIPKDRLSPTLQETVDELSEVEEVVFETGPIASADQLSGAIHAMAIAHMGSNGGDLEATKEMVEHELKHLGPLIDPQTGDLLCDEIHGFVFRNAEGSTSAGFAIKDPAPRAMHESATAVGDEMSGPDIKAAEWAVKQMDI